MLISAFEESYVIFLYFYAQMTKLLPKSSVSHSFDFVKNNVYSLFEIYDNM